RTSRMPQTWSLPRLTALELRAWIDLDQVTFLLPPHLPRSRGRHLKFLATIVLPQGRHMGLGIERYNGEHDPARHRWMAITSVHQGCEAQDQQAGEEAAVEDVSDHRMAPSQLRAGCTSPEAAPPPPGF